MSNITIDGGASSSLPASKVRCASAVSSSLVALSLGAVGPVAALLSNNISPELSKNRPLTKQATLFTTKCLKGMINDKKGLASKGYILAKLLGVGEQVELIKREFNEFSSGRVLELGAEPYNIENEEEPEYIH